ncbi:MAG: sugar kinase [Pseudonocardiaceae bacterium]|nr:sugar kinase [Pseudonocardiaceae bacterium]
MIRVLAIGECMIELTHLDGSTLSLGYAGDTFNTALYLSRLTEPDEVRVDYLTRLGDDPYSEGMLDAMRAEGIGTELISRVPGAQPGLYLVRTDVRGERSFTYYRSLSPARQLFDTDQPTEIDAELAGYDVIYLSAITLQLLTERAQERLRGLLHRARQRGSGVAFDSNYRPAGWISGQAARVAVESTWSLASVALPTFSDEQALFRDAGPEATVERLRGHGIEDIAVKDGANGCLVWDGAAVCHIPAEPLESIVDSTAAGDAFNAGYLAARLAGAGPVDAAARANAVAARVVGQPGAIVPNSVLPRRGS